MTLTISVTQAEAGGLHELEASLLYTAVQDSQGHVETLTEDEKKKSKQAWKQGLGPCEEGVRSLYSWERWEVFAGCCVRDELGP